MSDLKTLKSMLDKAGLTYRFDRHDKNAPYIEIDEGQSMYWEFNAEGELKKVWTSAPDYY